jgi:DNA repair protein RecO (recombination protein O)
MPAEKTSAIVLRIVDFSESSCVVTLYTEDFGKVSALAKGARRLRSPFEGAIDLLSICRIVFLRKSVDLLDLMTEARLVRRFRSASTHLPRLYAAMYVIEIVAALTDHAEPQPAIYHAMVNTITAIDSGEPIHTCLLQFEVQLLNELGHLPALHDCVDCGRKIDAGKGAGSVAFGMSAGGVYCDACRVGKRSVVKLHRQSLEWLRAFASRRQVACAVSESGFDYQYDSPANGDLPKNQKTPDSLPAVCRGELRGLLDQYLANLLGFRPGTAAWLRQVFKD